MAEVVGLDLQLGCEEDEAGEVYEGESCLGFEVGRMDVPELWRRIMGFRVSNSSSQLVTRLSTTKPWLVMCEAMAR